MAVGLAEQLPEPNAPEIVFAGRSNVGKSSLINKLTNRRQLARVSGTPGKTATINFYRADGFRLVDLPGYGFAKTGGDERRRYRALLDAYFSAARPRRLTVLLLDIRHAPSADDEEALAFFLSTGEPVAIALTKADKLNKTEYAQQCAAFDEALAGVPHVPVSVKNGEGIGKLIEWMGVK